MTLLSTVEQNRSLNLYYGANRGAIASSSHKLCLYAGDPRTTGAELTSTGGYVAVTVTNNGTNWPAASGGSKTSAVFTFPTSTAAWSDVADYFALKDFTTGDIADCGPLDVEVSVDAVGVVVSLSVTVYYDPNF